MARLLSKMNFSNSLSLALMLCLGAASSAMAQSTAAPVCFKPPALLSEADINAFLAAPGSLLVNNPQGGIQLSTRVRSLAGSSLSSVDSLLSIAGSATADQKAAIGAGLARASLACVGTDPLYAAQIQQKVAASNLADVVTAFIGASDEVQTASLGAAGAGGATGAAGIGNNGAAGPGSANAGGDAGTPTNGPAGFSSGGGARYFRSASSTVISP